MKTFLFSALFSISFIQIIGSDANILLQPHKRYNWAQIFAGGPGYPVVETVTKTLELFLWNCEPEATGILGR